MVNAGEFLANVESQADDSQKLILCLYISSTPYFIYFSKASVILKVLKS